MDQVAGPPAAAVAAVVLAAGGGRRYGGPKALVRFEGRLLVERAVATAAEAGCTPVLAVIGAAADQVRDRAELGPAIPVENPDWATGMGSSLRAGLAALADSEAVAAVILLVDMPGVTPEAVRRVARRATPDALAIGGYGDRRGHPVLLGRDHWPGVAALAVDDLGARPYLRRHREVLRVVPCADVGHDADLDTPPLAGGGGARDRSPG